MPDVVIRHHVHRYDPIVVHGVKPVYGVIVGAWQVGGQHVARIKNIKNRPMEVSGIIVEASKDGSGRVEKIHEFYKIFPQTRPEIINS